MTRARVLQTVLLTTHARAPIPDARPHTSGLAFVVKEPTTMSYDQRVVDLLRRRLPELTHPGDGSGAIALPVAAFGAARNLPPEVAQHFAEEAGLPHSDVPKLFAEAIVHLIETEADVAMVPRGELATMRAATAETERTRQLPIHCHCGTRLITVQVLDLNGTAPSVLGPEFITAVRQLGTECATGHRNG